MILTQLILIQLFIETVGRKTTLNLPGVGFTQTNLGKTWNDFEAEMVREYLHIFDYESCHIFDYVT